MDKMEFTTAEREALHYWRFHHPHPRVQRKMEALYLKSQGLAPEAISRLCAISKPTLYRYLHAYREGGIAKLQEVPFHRRQGQLAAYRTSIEADLRQRPPASVAEAAVRIAALTGLRRGKTQVRQFLKSLGMKPRKVGQIPAKADVAAQETFKTEQLEPRLEEAKSGQRVVFFMDAAHFVFAPFLGLMWCFERLFVKAPSGRQRLNVLVVLNATTREIWSVRNLTYITSETVCELLRLLAGAHPGMPLTIVLDNAAISDARWYKVWRRGSALSCCSYRPTRPISISLSASGSLSKSSVCTRSTMQTIWLSSKRLSNVLSRHQTHTRRR